MAALIADEDAQLDEWKKQVVLEMIIKQAQSPAQAQALVEYLVSVKWQQAFLDSEKRIRAGIELEIVLRMEHLAKLQQCGGGFCDRCNKEWTPLYSWPYPSHYRGKVYNRYCPDCLCTELETHQIMTTGNRTHYFSACEVCGRILPYSRFQTVFTGDTRAYCGRIKCCFPCSEGAAAKIFKVCVICGKKTINGITKRNFCFACKETYNPSVVTISQHLHRARTAGTPATLTMQEWIATVHYFGGKCAY